jgi:hypothetical protein
MVAVDGTRAPSTDVTVGRRVGHAIEAPVDPATVDFDALSQLSLLFRPFT